MSVRTSNRQAPDALVMLLAAAAFIIPLAATTSVSWPFSLPKLLLLGVFSALSLIVWCRRWLKGEVSVRWSPLLAPLAFLLGWFMLSTAFSVHMPTSILGKYGRYDGLLTFLSYLALFWVAFQHDWTQRDVSWLVTAALAGAGLVSIYALPQAVGLEFVNWGNVTFESNRAFSTFGNPSLLAGYLVLVLFTALGWGLRGAILGWSVGALSGVALLVTLTRGGWLAAAVGLAFLVAGLIRAGRFRFAWKTVATVLVLLFVVGLAVITFSATRPGAVSLPNRLRQVTSQGGTVAERFEIWKAATGATMARPLLGWGPDNFRVAFAEHKTPRYVRTSGPAQLQDNAHNYLLQLAVTSGIPAAVLFTVFLTWSIWVITTRALASKNLLMLGVAAGLVGYAIDILFTVNVVGGAFLFWLLLGMALSRSTPFGGGVAVAKLYRTIAVVILLPVALVLAVAPTFEFAADYYRTRAVSIVTSVSLAAALPDFEQAFALNPWLDRYHFQLGDMYFSSALESRQSADFELGRRQFTEARSVNPLEVDNLLFLAQIDILAWENEAGGDLGRAETALNELMTVEPLSVPARYFSALVLSSEGDDVKATALLKEALDIYPGDKNSSELLSVIRQRQREK